MRSAYKVSEEDPEALNDLDASIEIGREYKTVDHTPPASEVTADYYTKHCLRQLVDAQRQILRLGVPEWTLKVLEVIWTL